MRPAGTSSVKIGYLIKCFPRLSETFILHEVLELERQGLSLNIFSILRPEGRMNDAARQTRSPVAYFPQGFPVGLLMLLAAVARRFIKNPLAFLRIAGTALVRFHHRATLRHIVKAAYLAERLEEAGITHLHAHYANAPATVALLAHQLTGIPFSFTAHAKDIYLSPRPSLAYKMRQASHVVTCTGYNQRYLASLLGPHDRVAIHQIYHGLDLYAFPADSSTLRVPSERPLVLSVARLVEKKGLRYLLQAIRRLLDQGYDLNLAIVGEGPLRPRLEQQIRELALGGRVRLCGAVPHERVIDMYRQATVMALPSVVAENGDRDGIPNVLAEALYMGVPVVSTPVSGIPELITAESNGLLVPERDDEALAFAIARLLDDVELRARLAAAGRQTVLAHFDMSANAGRLVSLFLNRELTPAPPARDTRNDYQIASFPHPRGNVVPVCLDEKMQRKAG